MTGEEAPADRGLARRLKSAAPGEVSLDAEGRVAYRSGPGPWGFKPEELEAAIREAVGE